MTNPRDLTARLTSRERDVIVKALSAYASEFFRLASDSARYVSETLAETGNEAKSLANFFQALLSEEQLRHEVRVQMNLGNKINAIKRVREVTLLGLKEAKDYVEKIHAESQPEF